MDKLKEYALTALRWVKSRNALTLAVGYGAGVLTGDMLIALVRGILGIF